MTPESMGFSPEEFSREVIGEGRSGKKERPRKATLSEIAERERAGRDSVSGVERLGGPSDERSREAHRSRPEIIFNREKITLEEAEELRQEYEKAIERIEQDIEAMRKAGQESYEVHQKRMAKMTKDLAEAIQVANMDTPIRKEYEEMGRRDPTSLQKAGILKRIQIMISNERKKAAIEEAIGNLVPRAFEEMKNRQDDIERLEGERVRLERVLSTLKEALRSSRSIDVVEFELKEAVVHEKGSKAGEWLEGQLEKAEGTKSGLLARVDQGMRGLWGKIKGGYDKLKASDPGSLVHELEEEVEARKWKPAEPEQQVASKDKEDVEQENLSGDIVALRELITDSKKRIEKMRAKVMMKRESLPEGKYDSIKKREIIDLSRQIKTEEDELELRQKELRDKGVELLRRESLYKKEPLKTVDRGALKHDLDDAVEKLRVLNEKKERLEGKYGKRRGGLYDKLVEEIEETVRVIDQKRKLLGIDDKTEPVEEVRDEDIVSAEEIKKTPTQEQEEEKNLKRIEELWKSGADVWIKRKSGEWQVGKIAFLVDHNLKVEWFNSKEGKRQEKFVDIEKFLGWQKEKGPVDEGETVIVSPNILERGRQERIREIRKGLAPEKETPSENVYRKALEERIKEAVAAVEGLNEGVKVTRERMEKITKKDNKHWPENRKKFQAQEKSFLEEQWKRGKELNYLKGKLEILDQSPKIDASHNKYSELQAYAKKNKGRLPPGEFLENYLTFSSRDYEKAYEEFYSIEQQKESIERKIDDLEERKDGLGFFSGERRQVAREIKSLRQERARLEKSGKPVSEKWGRIVDDIYEHFGDKKERRMMVEGKSFKREKRFR